MIVGIITSYLINCSPGYSGSQVIYTVPGGTYTSTVSQAEADAQATDDINANGQNYANTHGTCVIAQVIYAKVSTENLSTVGNYTYGNVVVRFYSDAQLTVPYNANNLVVNFKETVVDEYVPSSSDNLFSQACTGNSVVIKNQTVLSIWHPATETWIDYYYYLMPGTGYSY